MVRKGATSTAKKGANYTTPKGAKKSKKIKFYIDCSVPVEDGIFDLDHFGQYVKGALKVDGKKGQLGDKVTVFKSKNRLYVKSVGWAFQKKYLKYLTKKYLKKNELRDWLRMTSHFSGAEETRENGYALKYFNITSEKSQETKADEKETE